MSKLLLFLPLLVACTDPATETRPKKQPSTATPHHDLRFLPIGTLLKGYRAIDLKDKKGAPKVTSGLFVKYKGLKTGYRLWKGDVIIIESRWLFPSDKEARGFFKEAEKLNAEGLTPQGPLALGQGGQLYSGRIKHPKLPIALRSSVAYFLVGHMVAKLFIAWEQREGKSRDLTPLLRTLAAKAAARITGKGAPAAPPSDKSRL